MHLLSHKFKKSIIFIMVFVLISSLLVILPSAQEDSRAVPDTVIEAGTYRFANRIGRLTFQAPTEEYPTFICNGIEYYQISFIGDDTNFIVTYGNGDITHDVYDSRYGWVDSSYQIITFVYDYSEETQNFTRWFYNYAKPYTPPQGIYFDIFDIIATTIYGDSTELDTFQNMTITLLSTCACVVVVALPLIIVFWLCKYLFSLHRFF